MLKQSLSYKSKSLKPLPSKRSLTEGIAIIIFLGEINLPTLLETLPIPDRFLVVYLWLIPLSALISVPPLGFHRV